MVIHDDEWHRKNYPEYAVQSYQSPKDFLKGKPVKIVKRKIKYKKQPLYTRISAETKKIYKTNAIAAREVKRANTLVKLEDVIQKGFDTFLKVGLALTEIREKQLWNDGYESFEDYLQKRWEWSKRYGNQIIAAAAVKKILGPSGPKTEAVARQLVPLTHDQDKMKSAWQRALQTNPKPTAKVVRAIVRGRESSIKDDRQVEAEDPSSAPTRDQPSQPIKSESERSPLPHLPPPSPGEQPRQGARLSAKTTGQMGQHLSVFAKHFDPRDRIAITLRPVPDGSNAEVVLILENVATGEMIEAELPVDGSK